MDEQPSYKVVRQRVRNRIIEYLELVSCSKSIEEYQRAAPVCVLGEVINQWEDWANLQAWSLEENCPLPTFTEIEQQKILSYNHLWNVTFDNLSSEIHDVYQFLETKEYSKLRDLAKECLDEFMKRGRMDEEVEIT